MVLCGYRISFCFYTDSYHNQDLQRHLNHNLYCRKMKTTDFKVNDSNYVGYRKEICVQFFIIYVQFFIRSTRLIFVCCPCMRLHCVIAESNASHLHLCPQIEMIGVNLKQNEHLGCILLRCLKPVDVSVFIWPSTYCLRYDTVWHKQLRENARYGISRFFIDACDLFWVILKPA